MVRNGYLNDVAEQIVRQHRHGSLIVPVVAVEVADLCDDIGGGGRVGHPPRALGRQCQGLLTEDVAARLDRGDKDRFVRAGGRTNAHDVEVVRGEHRGDIIVAWYR